MSSPAALGRGRRRGSRPGEFSSPRACSRSFAASSSTLAFLAARAASPRLRVASNRPVLLEHPGQLGAERIGHREHVAHLGGRRPARERWQQAERRQRDLLLAHEVRVEDLRERPGRLADGSLELRRAHERAVDLLVLLAQRLGMRACPAGGPRRRAGPARRRRGAGGHRAGGRDREDHGGAEREGHGRERVTQVDSRAVHALGVMGLAPAVREARPERGPPRVARRRAANRRVSATRRPTRGSGRPARTTRASRWRGRSRSSR